MSAVEHPQNVVSLPREQPPAGAERAAKNIITLLQQAANAAKRNEERARLQAAHWHQQFELSQTRLAELQEAFEQAQERAVSAEQWIEHIFKSVQESLLHPLLARSAEAESSGENSSLFDHISSHARRSRSTGP